MAELSGQNVSWFLALVYDWFLSNRKSKFWRKFRLKLLKNKFKSFGEGSGISWGCKFIDIESISVGKNTVLPNSTVFDGRGGLEIGDNCMIGFQSIIVTSTHVSELTDIPMHEQGMYKKPIKIGDDVWMGTRVVVLPGATIGSHSIVGAGAVVTKDVPKWAVVGGVPARLIKMRK